MNKVFGLLVLSASLSSLGETHYVNLNSPSPTAPYTNWITAATSIQDAVDASVEGDPVVEQHG